MRTSTKLVDIEEFRRQAAAGSANVAVRLASTSEPVVTDEGNRTIRFVFSDGSVDRYNDIVDPNGWDLRNFIKNPVALFGHDASKAENVIGKASNLSTAGGKLTGDITFAPKEVNPVAETVFQMVKGGFLNAVSVGFNPTEYGFTKDANRPGGIDFKKQELLEISVVPIPALPSALVQARAAGIDVDALLRATAAAADWKCGATRDLSVDDKATWDGPAAAKRMLDAAGFDGDSPDSAAARRGFLVYDAANPTLRGSYKEPFADLIGGELKAVKGGLDAAASRLPQTDAPQAVRDEARAVLDHYEAKMKKGAKVVIKDLWAVSWLAMLLADLAMIEDDVEWEAEMEGDGSKVPAMLADALNQLGQALIAMTQEEVGELLDEENQPNASDYVVGPDGDMPVMMALRVLRAIRKLDRAQVKSFAEGMEALAAGREVMIREVDGVSKLLHPIIKAGRVLSSANEQALTDAHVQMTGACDVIRSVLDQVAKDDDGPVQMSADERERVRTRARVLSLTK